MIVLTDLTHDGFLQIKKDREQLSCKILQYQAIIDEFDLALPFLSAIYEPKITIEFNENINHYIAKTTIPFNGDKISISEKLGGKLKFDGVQDPNLIQKANDKIMNNIRRQFPLHFEG